MPYFTTTNTFRFSLVLSGFITLVACGGVNEETLPINEAPAASRVTITDDNAGNFVVGDSLTGSYVYADAENDTEGVSIYRWLRNGKFIDSTTISTYILVAADVGQSITFEVTPVAEAGTAIGNAALSNIITIYSAPVADAGADQTAVFGDRVTLNGSASSDVDGDPLTYSWSFISRPPSSTATLISPTTISPSFDIDVSGDYVVQLIVNDGTLSSVADTVTISTSNSAPVADAGVDQAAVFGDRVTLNGSASSDVDGDPLTYRWSLTSMPLGSGAALTGPTTVNPSFDIDLSGDYVAQLIVNDGTLNSVPGTVIISTTNSAPVADAGADQTPLVGETVALNGSTSSDVDGDPLTYRWSLTSKPASSATVLPDPAAVNPSFAIDVSGNYVVQLIVNDGTLNSAADTVTISTTNSAPVADAGAGQTPLVGDTVTLNGSASSDVDGDPLTYRWSLTSMPLGSGAALTGPTTVNPRFDIDLSGDYVAQLIVNDGTLNSAADTVTISTTNSAPVADASVDQAAVFGETVTLNGSASSDVDGDPLTYSWSLTSKPASSVAVLSDSTAVNPGFDIDVSGDYVAQLIVNDGTVDSAADTVTISTSNSAPVADAGADQAALFGDRVNLNGSDSSDVDGDPLTYRWSLTSMPLGSGAALTGPTTVNPNFSIDVSGDYVAQLIVNDGTVDSVPGTVTISTANSAPVADAGTDQTPLVGETVALNGSGSSDVDNDGLTYSWSLNSVPLNSMAALSDTAAISPAFVVDLPGTYVAQLIVHDGTVSSAPDTVSIITANRVPVADAGPDQNAFVNDTVTLNGDGSSDADNDPLTFIWSLTVPTGSLAVLSDPAVKIPTFVVDLPGSYVAQLIVNDGTLDSAADTVTISASNRVPVADAGPDQNAFVNDTVTLNGDGSSDADNDPLTFLWSLTVPTGSLAVLSDPAVKIPTFVVDLPGSYVAQLIVNDGTLDSAADTVTISASNRVPVADAGPDQNAFVNDTVTLNGDGSSDADNDPLTFLWSLTVPTGSLAVLSDPAVKIPTFVVDLPGSYVAQLIVNDGTVNSAPDTVTISASNRVPVADAGPDQNAFVNDTVTLNGDGSSDADNDPLTFLWSLTVPTGSLAVLSDPIVKTPTFVVDLPGSYVAQLIVNDGTVNSAPDTVTISASNRVPVADAGPDQNAFVNDTVTLNGDGSSDADNDPLTFLWSLTVPTGSLAVLSDPIVKTPTFVVDLPGSYVAQLIVNDGTVNSTPDTVIISAP